LSGLNLELSTALTQSSLFDNPEGDTLQAIRERVQSVVSNVPLDAFRRDKALKKIRDQYKQTQSQPLLIEALDEFFIENELYRDVVEPKTTLEQIRSEELHLIAYEVFG